MADRIREKAGIIGAGTNRLWLQIANGNGPRAAMNEICNCTLRHVMYIMDNYIMADMTYTNGLHDEWNDLDKAQTGGSVDWYVPQAIGCKRR